VSRIVTGIGNGVNTALVPTWVAETAKSEHRGKLIATQLTTAIVGIVVCITPSPPEPRNADLGLRLRIGSTMGFFM
jgi:MFS family permease